MALNVYNVTEIVKDIMNIEFIFNLWGIYDPNQLKLDYSRDWKQSLLRSVNQFLRLTDLINIALYKQYLLKLNQF